MKTVSEEMLVNKYRKAEREIVAVWGRFSLFGLFRHEESPGKLDLIVAAPWLTADRSGLLTLAPYLPRLTPEEGALVGRIIALSPDAAFVRELSEMAGDFGFTPETEDEAVSFSSVPQPDFPVTGGYVIASNALPTLHPDREKAKVAA